jgi:hypothetical protein
VTPVVEPAQPVLVSQVPVLAALPDTALPSPAGVTAVAAPAVAIDPSGFAQPISPNGVATTADGDPAGNSMPLPDLASALSPTTPGAIATADSGTLPVSAQHPVAAPAAPSAGGSSSPLSSSPVALLAIVALLAVAGRDRLPELTLRFPSPIFQTIPVPPG